MFPFNPLNFFAQTVFCLIIVQMVNSTCDVYNSLDWSNDDINFQKISGLYSVITTSYQANYGACEVHGISQTANNAILDKYKKTGSPCSTVYRNLITKTTNAFQFNYSGDDLQCMPRSNHRTVDNMKMKVLPDGECFFKAFCLPDGTPVINLLCRNPDTFWITQLLNPIINIVLALLGNSLYYIDQSCYNQIVNNPSDLALLLGS
ncbi:uncharacterized protein LOC119078197 [Bradysia coprophila]|uniref:uncharacterized protein LOC119078197 n=1 Tax=Bradysia coprophila TaxID=38358 RepID=UPI00187DB43F|nr:uncharacterized protein LOC119078197 [Bradysia coprophila]